MKPWFERDAKIIKFPEPEKKVIQMPNVASYPDFITGVSDLQARHKEGQISQDSYDKLYAELIQRFMKKESFETPWFVREQKVSKRKANRGDAMEFILAVALWHRLDKVQYISDKSLLAAILQLPPGTSVKAQKREKGDIFNLDVQVKADIVPYLFAPESYQPGGVYDGLVTKAANFANAQLQKQIQFIHNNNRKDNVELNSFGVSGSKVDLEAYVNYKDENGQLQRDPIEDLQMSLKVDSGKFGQASGFSAEDGKSFSKLFGGMGFPDAIKTVLAKNEVARFAQSKKYTDLVSKATEKSPLRKGGKKSTGYAQAEQAGQEANAMAMPVVRKIYTDMAGIMKKRFAGPKDEKQEYITLGNFISSEIGATDGGVISLVAFNDKGYSLMSNQQIRKLKKFVTQQVELDVALLKERNAETGVNPTILFVDLKTKKVFFQIRSTFNHYGYLRNFIEQGPGMDQFKSVFN